MGTQQNVFKDEKIKKNERKNSKNEIGVYRMFQFGINLIKNFFLIVVEKLIRKFNIKFLFHLN